MGLILVVNIHGKINSQAAVRKALSELKVERKFSATVVTDDSSTMGMLRLCKDYIAWSQLDADLLSSLLKSRGEVAVGKRLGQKELKTLGFGSYEELARKMVDGNLRLSAIEGVRPCFRLSPPRGGFKRSSRRQFTQKGILGANASLPELVRRMM
jgi:large subunit ribosomal protein L30